MMSLRDSILRKAILFLLRLGCRKETLDIASIDFFQEILLINWLYIVASDYAIPQGEGCINRI